MPKEIKLFIQEGTLKMTDDEIRKQCKKDIGILYGTSYYNNSLEYINELKDAIHKDYPDIKDKDIEVWRISNTQSIRHASMTMLYAGIPVEDFIKLRQEGKIYIL